MKGWLPANQERETVSASQMPHNRSFDSDTLRQGVDHLCVERPLCFAVTDCFWPNAVAHDQRTGQPQPAQAVSSTGICS